MRGYPDDEIIAVVITPEQSGAVSGDVPIFVAKDTQEKEAISAALSRTTKCMVHELPNGVYILIRH